MIGQNGTLVILVRDFLAASELNPGVYFGFKVGNNCIRFNQLRDDLIFPVKRDESELPIEVFVMQRRPRLKNSIIGRRRDLLDHCKVHYTKQPVVKSDERCVEWKLVELKLTSAHMTFLVDIEFYPAVPQLPSKHNRMRTRSEPKEEISAPEPKRDLSQPEAKAQLQRHRSQPEARVQPPKEQADGRANDKTTGTDKKPGSRRKRDKIKALIVGGPKDKASSRPSSKSADANVIYYDLSTPKVGTASDGYKHGESQPAALPIPLSSSETLVLSEKKPEIIEDEVLSLDISPKDFFSDVGNRVKHDQGMNFTSMFSSQNTSLTGYLGKGKWCEPQAVDNLLYLQPGVKPLPGPPLPPKCPQGMLWEEYYLLNHELYSKTVLR